MQSVLCGFKDVKEKAIYQRKGNQIIGKISES